jgi:AcrR family transcriptional regulator
VTEIAARAGVAKSTFFRYFPYKREILVAGQETLSELLARGIAHAPAGASPLEAVASGLECVSSAMGPMNRDLGPRMKGGRGRQHGAPRARSTEESGPGRSNDRCSCRARCPGLDRTSRQRDGSPRVKQGFAEWCDADNQADHDLAQYTLSALNELRAAATSLG